MESFYAGSLNYTVEQTDDVASDKNGKVFQKEQQDCFGQVLEVYALGAILIMHNTFCGGGGEGGVVATRGVFSFFPAEKADFFGSSRSNLILLHISSQ